MATSEPLRRVQYVEESGFGRTVVREGELLRHSFHTRVVHWGVALFFVAALLSGFALYTPFLYKLLAPLLGGGPRARLLHPWFGLGFVLLLILQLRGWRAQMRWSDADRRWIGRVREYVTKSDGVEPPDVPKFNAGQKIWFWVMIVSGVVFLVTGVLMWYPEIFGRTPMWISYFFHDLAGLIMLGGFIVHIYEGTAAMPGTFSSMTRGTVTEAWARTHHPAWFREVTGQDDAGAGSRPPRT